MRPPEGFSDAVLEAARIAGIGVGVSVVEPTGVRNVWFNEVAIEILGHPREDLLAGSAFSFIARRMAARIFAR